MIRIVVLTALILIALPLASHAVEPDEMLANPVLEVRARAISKDLRCVVCQNQDIDSSNAGVARDLRLLVRERLMAGDTDQQVLGYIQARYGDYVLLKPPFKPETYVLWLTPLILFLIGSGGAVAVLARSGRRMANADLSDEEERRVSKLLAQTGRNES
ncbi:cytochrome c-type biogenesis protein [Aliiroseovarius sp. F47248L]|uniref:cytochrome c-type biogenesis protein n=1 Tax=Aliiroseovarius sp. F47248L TaxID=2926420 RepID=UPI001FF557A9|nr:cytochrome c-type biogenesis protein [Aliiroseovarius sp. F47248L]MCK0137921.1 cytochrome c-type biogenesis protein CcmH [Aliiroseovarius sp. F47248L]